MNIESIVERALCDELFTVCEIGYLEGGKRSIRRWGERRERLFDLASLTKLFTTAVTLSLIDRGVLSLSSGVSSLLPIASGSLRKRLAPITVSQLLTHHSTLPAWHPFYVHATMDFYTTLETALTAEGASSGMCYSDLNYMLLAQIIEEHTHMSLERAIRTLIIEPFGLGDTTYHPDPSHCVPTEWGNRIERKMVEERNLSFDGWREEGRAIQGEADDGNAFYYFGGTAGHAGLFSSTDDLLTFASRFLDGFISETLKESVFTDWGDTRGLGCHSGELFPCNGWGHTGFTGTYLYVNPTDNRVLTILTNRLNVPDPRSIHEFRIAIARACLAC
ncbi:MAG: serine hydrolase domain-containing protein [Sphaerochaeta sp.]|jgi:CubicO group peptidase (beta-lactamase class C family)|nr:serine hydrolase domain-containing protein [Sphaerochaeta sp.]